MKTTGLYGSYIRSAQRVRAQKWFFPVSAVVFDCLLFLMLAYFGIYRASHWVVDRVWLIDENTIFMMIRVLMGVSVILEIFYSPLRACAACAVLCIYCFVPVSHMRELLCEVFILAFLSNLGTRRNNLNMWLFVYAFFFGVLLLLRMFGWVDQVFAGTGKFALSSIGRSFGMGHPNAFGIFCMTVLLAVWICRKRKTWLAFPVFIPAAALVFYLTWSRTATAAMVLFPFMLLAVELLSRLKGNRMAWIVGLFPWLMALITLGVSLYACNRPEGYPEGAFWMRFNDFRVIREYSFSLFGKDNTGDIFAYFDNLYWWLTSYTGIVGLVLVLAGYSYMNIRLWKEKQTALLAMAMMFLVYAIMENVLVHPFHFIVPYLAFARPDGVAPSPLTENQIV